MGNKKLQPLCLENLIALGERYKITELEIGGRNNTSGDKPYLLIDFSKKVYRPWHENTTLNREDRFDHRNLIADQMTRTLMNELVAKLNSKGYRTI